MKDKRVFWAMVIGVLMTMAFVFYVFEMVRVFRSINASIDQIRFDTGFGLLALMGMAPVIAVCEVYYLKGWITPAMLERWGGKAFIALFIGLVVTGETVIYWLEAKLERAGYVGCISPQEISRISRGHSMIFLKTTCDDLKS
jgi:hypothetical protein